MTTSIAQLQALSEAQWAQYDRDGYFVASRLFTAGEIAEIGEAFAEQTRLPAVPGLNDLKFEPGDPLSAYPRMMHPQRHTDKRIGRISMRYLLDPRVGRILRDLIGEEPLGAQVMYYFKPPGARGQALHQDNFYLRVQPGTCIAAWTAIDDADEENGSLTVVPGSHRMDVICPHAADSKLSISSEEVDLPPGSSTKVINLKAGDVMFFNGSLIHGSFHNKSSRFRRAFISHYVPASCAQLTDWCRPLYAFDGGEVARDFTTGGGDCSGGGGVVSAGSPH